MTPRECAAALRLTVLRTLRPLLTPDRAPALIDFPHYANVGDSAIYLGQLACLRDLDVPPPCFVCDLRTYDPHALARRLGDGTVLLAGGGNFGDLWPDVQECREAIIGSFPRNRIIQLPQTIHFRSADALRRSQRVLDAHPDLTLLVRDGRSLEIARNEFRAPSELCPDMAFCLTGLARPRTRRRGIVWLGRTDQESAAPAPDEAAALRTDWLDEPATLLRAIADRLIARTRTGHGRTARALLRRTYAPLARQRLRRGLDRIGAADVLVTDRLHGHILGLLLGIPQVLLDNSYGKLSSFHATWTDSVDGVHLADSAAAALELARALEARAAAPALAGGSVDG